MSAAVATRLDSTTLETQLRIQAESLACRNADLERAIQDLEQVAFMASHDLREPLRMITDHAQHLAQKLNHAPDAETVLLATNIVAGAARMNEMLSDLLAYTVLGARPIKSTEAVDLNLILDNTRQSLKASIDDTQARIVNDHLPIVHAHAADLISLFQNLIANAIKYRSELPPEIRISVLREHGELRFAVSDNGIGIDPAYHVEIFEPFKRLHGESVPGTGLGLAICRRVIDRYAGRIWVESQVGKGATFVFTFPQDERQLNIWP